MMKRKEGYVLGLVVLVSLMSVGLLRLAGCSNPPKKLDPSKSGPQVIVNPETIRLGIAKVLDTPIVFEGSGFKSKESIYIELSGPNQTKLVVAESVVQQDGTFKAEVSKLTRITEILRADASFEIEKKYREFVIISQPPIPEGLYRAKVVCMSSDMTAETKLNVKGPSILDRTKDLLGRMLGKIRYKKAT
ncbi:MAG: hypothetical protein ACUVWO_06265 [Thermodesulfobacteriota bacterium]